MRVFAALPVRTWYPRSRSGPRRFRSRPSWLKSLCEEPQRILTQRKMPGRQAADAWPFGKHPEVAKAGEGTVGPALAKPRLTSRPIAGAD
jgi:hypothetical protein